MITEKELQELDEIEAAASPGPWDYEHTRGCKQIGPRVDGETIEEVACTPGLYDETEDEANAIFMSRARTAWPLLRDEVRQLHALLEETITTAQEALKSKSGHPQIDHDLHVKGYETALRKIAGKK